MPHRVVIVTCLLAVAAGGCGSRSDEKQIAAVTSDMVSALKAKDWKRVCDQYSTKARKELEAMSDFVDAEGCEETVKKVHALIGDDVVRNMSGKISGVKIDGLTATGRVNGETTRYVKENGEWKLDADPDAAVDMAIK
jgi:hypothetical protein